MKTCNNSVLIVGGGGREHALGLKLLESPRVGQLYFAPGNGGTASIGKNVPIKADEVRRVVDFAVEHKLDLVVVAPDDPLMLGMVDELEAAGIRAFGPRQNAAVIEGSKSFAKTLMIDNHIPTAAFDVFEDADAAVRYITHHGAPIVIKADGLALGKGVTVAMNTDEAILAVRAAMEDGAFGTAGSRVVIEDFMTGPEVSVLCFTDGVTIKPMVSAQDHKRVFDNDRGPNTGGMGAFAPSPNYTPELAELCMRTIFRPTVDAMARMGRRFQGVLYFGLMLTPDGPKVVEYNARFGDPETQAVLPLLKSDLFDIFNAVIDGTLASQPVEFSGDAAACVVMSSGGYPGSYEKGKLIAGLSALPDGVIAVHAGTAVTDDGYVTNGGRVLGVTATGTFLGNAIASAYEGVSKISFEGAHYRSDIGKK